MIVRLLHTWVILGYSAWCVAESLLDALSVLTTLAAATNPARDIPLYASLWTVFNLLFLSLYLC